MMNSIRCLCVSPRAVIALCMCLCGCATPFAESVERKKPPAAPDAWSGKLSDTQRVDIQVGLARTLERQGDLERAEKIYRGILKGHPSHRTTLHRLAIVCDQQLRFDESGPLFRKALEQSPEDHVILGDYGYSLYRQQKWGEAEKIFRKVIAIDPRDMRAHTHLGLVLAQTNRRDEALASFCRAGCSEAQAHSNLKTVFELNGRTEEAAHEALLASDARSSKAPGIAGAENADAALIAEAEASLKEVRRAHHSSGEVGSSTRVQPAAFTQESVEEPRSGGPLQADNGDDSGVVRL